MFPAFELRSLTSSSYKEPPLSSCFSSISPALSTVLGADLKLCQAFPCRDHGCSCCHSRPSPCGSELCFPEAAQHQVKQLEAGQDHAQEASHQHYKFNFIVPLFRRFLVFPILTLLNTF